MHPHFTASEGMAALDRLEPTDHRGQDAGSKASPGQLMVLQCRARRHARDDANHRDESTWMDMVELHRVHDPVVEHDQDQHRLQGRADRPQEVGERARPWQRRRRQQRE